MSSFCRVPLFCPCVLPPPPSWQLRVSKAHAESEANFQRDRHAAAEALIASCRKDILDERASKGEIQALLTSVQR